MVVSALARTEVYALGLTEEQKAKYRAFFNRRNATEQAVTGAICEKAAEIRTRTQIKKDKTIEMMKTPDAVHLATAIILGVDEFHTFDGTAKKPRRFSLIQLSGTPAVDGLTICVPFVPPSPQGTLFPSEPSST